MIRALRRAAADYLSQQETPVPVRWNRVTYINQIIYKEIPVNNRDGNTTSKLIPVAGFCMAPKYSCNCMECTDQDGDSLSKHVVCRGFESHFRPVPE
ncbi:hypothetical protein [Pedobacter zeae]|uniref:Uncharacterized protein n=1 Tax=Pedobacter zeae TaxID=1737356 RepID=A0A7W6KG28_9SPHI|nr:hypothetical protein [Pedobacter zeae]MBB4110030.1 hypothetical protein [Pedobacter zeae]GGH15627.1 hypothetical protein GCM10007422_37780 [Pedobacter zeae]